MARPDPSLLDPARYPYACEIPTRYADLDTNRHINNAAFAVLIEEGRARFHGASGNRMDTGLWQVLVASVSIDYLAQAYYPAPVKVHSGYLHLGRSSYQLGQLITQDGRPVVLARTVMVCVADGVATPLAETFVANAQGWMVAA